MGVNLESPLVVDGQVGRTITADGAFWSPFGPTVAESVLDTDLLLTRTPDPRGTPAGALLRLVEGPRCRRPDRDPLSVNPPGRSVRLGCSSP